MPVFQLSDKLIFPHPALAEPNGLLAIGGDLSVQRLLMAYSNGIFPWYSDGSPIMWWALNPRMVLFPDKFKLSKSLKQTLIKGHFTFTFDNAFVQVIQLCATSNRKAQDGTWITEEMKNAYIDLHNEGFAHSVETWNGDKLAGGLYGLSMGGAFFGESMFFEQRDASKAALYFLTETLKKWDFDIIDVQQETSHLRTLGAETVSLEVYLDILKKSLKRPTIKGKWCL
jgi:leucyl/phenylalanyl-tRNA---protein transferase